MFVSESKSRRAVCRPFSRVKDFASQEDGAMIGFSLLLFLAMFIFAGLAIDVMRHEHQRTRIQATMDRALLAAANPDQKRDRKSVVLDYFSSAGLDGIVKREDVIVKVASDGTSITATSRSNINTPFMNFVGVSNMPVPAGGGAAKAIALTEVSLVVDVSGSMGNATVQLDENGVPVLDDEGNEQPKTDADGNTVTKIAELRKAATQFSNLLLCDQNVSTTPANWSDCPIKSPKTSLSLVPYSTQVNVGATILEKFDRRDAQTDAYCVTFDDSDFTSTSVVPKVDMINAPETAVTQAAKFFRYHQNSWRGRGEFFIQSDDHSSKDAYWSCHTDSWREVAALEDNPEHMKARIDALKASGDTAIDIGMKWGVALLDSSMEPVVTSLITDGDIHGNFAGRPFDPNTTASKKFVVLMTDGQNTRHHHLADGYRTGPSLFWINRQRNIISVLDKGPDLNSDLDDTYIWFDRDETERREQDTYNGHRGMPNYIVANEPYGLDGAADCITNRHGTEHCATAGNNTTERLDWEEFWSEGYTWRMFELEAHSRFKNRNNTTNLIPGRLLDNGENSGHTDPIDGTPIKEIDKRLLDQCNAAKLAGITIYTIELQTPNTATDAMQKCASVKKGERLHYKVSASLDLATVFNKIAEDINRLRLTH